MEGKMLFIAGSLETGEVKSVLYEGDFNSLEWGKILDGFVNNLETKLSNIAWSNYDLGFQSEAQAWHEFTRYFAWRLKKGGIT